MKLFFLFIGFIFCRFSVSPRLLKLFFFECLMKAGHIYYSVVAFHRDLDAWRTKQRTESELSLKRQ